MFETRILILKAVKLKIFCCSIILWTIKIVDPSYKGLYYINDSFFLKILLEQDEFFAYRA